jgi:hypothetical protein
MTDEDVYREFTESLYNAADPWPELIPERTLLVKQALHKVGNAFEPSGSCKAYYTAERNGEFMLDFCCMHPISHNMLLAAESEWINNVGKIVDDDFQKLVYVRSRFKMMIFAMDESKVLDQAKLFLGQYQDHSDGDSYLFVRIDWNGRKISGWKIAVGQNHAMIGPTPIDQ